MKKTILLAVVCVALMSGACRKTRTCNCTATDNITSTSTTTSGSSSVTTNTTTIKTTTTKSSADSQKKDNFIQATNCNNRNDSWTNVSTYTVGTYVTTNTDAHSVDYDCKVD